MSSGNIRIAGEIWGRRYSPDTGAVTGEVVHVAGEHRPAGPAENALVFVEFGSGGVRRCRYIAWINYYDVEHAEQRQPGRWRLVDPPQDYAEDVLWLPYGWSGDTLPSVADTSPHSS